MMMFRLWQNALLDKVQSSTSALGWEERDVVNICRSMIPVTNVDV